MPGNELQYPSSIYRLIGDYLLLLTAVKTLCGGHKDALLYADVFLEKEVAKDLVFRANSFVCFVKNSYIKLEF